MGMMEDFYIKIRSKVHEFGKTTGKYVDISKLKIRIAECENDINVKLQKIGQIVCEKVKNNEEIEQIDVIDIVDEINELRKSADECNMKINRLKGKCVCDVCKSLNEFDSQFCSSCGNSLSCDDSCNCDSSVDGE